MSDSVNKVHVVYRHYFNGCDYWDSVESIHKDDITAGLRAIELGESEGDEWTSFNVSSWDLED